MAVSPRRPKGPHLNALRAFEATARLGSFSMAAEELSVTAGAVTQHVKALEAWAGTKLFARKAHGVELTNGPQLDCVTTSPQLTPFKWGFAAENLRSPTMRFFNPETDGAARAIELENNCKPGLYSAGSFCPGSRGTILTAGAVTQHVKALEAHMGWDQAFCSESTWKAHGVELTPLAEELLPRFSYAFDELGHAVQMLRTKATPNRIKIATLPSIAQLWLAPRLGRLRQIAPEVSVSVFAMEAPPNLIREPFDMTLFFSIEPTGTKNVELFRDRIYPVCSPEIAKRLKVIKDLKSETLLHDNAWLNDWDLWLGAVPDAKGINSAGTVHSLFAVALEEARHSGGVLMAHEALVAPLLRSGELVKPFDDDLELPHKLIASPTKAFAKTPIYERVVQVLFEEA